MNGGWAVDNVKIPTQWQKSKIPSHKVQYLGKLRPETADAVGGSGVCPTNEICEKVL